MDNRLYRVIGMDDLEGLTFALCSTYEKAQKAKALLENERYEDMLDIIQDEIPVDAIELNGEMIYL